MNLKKIAILSTFASFLFLFSACVEEEETTLPVAVAANMTSAMGELIGLYQSDHPEVTVEAVYLSSGKLSTQIQNGADFALFLAANLDFPQQLFENGFAAAAPEVYAKGKLLLFSTSGEDLFGILSNSDAFVAVANPKLAPYGRAATEYLSNTGLFDAGATWVFTESIAQTAEFALTASDAAFIAASGLVGDAMSEYDEEGTYYVELNPALYSPIEQGVVLLSSYAEDETAKEFYDFLFSAEAVKILKDYGYACE